MRGPEFYSAVYLIIKNEKGEVLVGRRISNFKNGYFQIIPAGHLEGEEDYITASIREAKEELGIEVKKEDLKIIHICHRVMKGERVYFDIYLDVEKYNGTIKRCEDDKCSEIKFVDINNLDDDKYVMYDIETIRKAYSGESFSDIITN
ncbi:MAG: NUDIX domain-containing protein [Candidatus Gracilibacteria bacterium]|nr:NUDIX domain-containing protein [Candidatus Gracilibacteria bacterium]